MEVKDDLLKEAIADARAVRETALENAKISLEEAFNPHVKAMLAKQIQSEIDEDDDFEEDEEEEAFEDEEGGEEDIAVEPEEGEDEFAGDDEEEIEFEEGEEDLEDDEGAFDGAADEFEAEDEEEEDELDLEATIKELEADLEDDDEEEVDFEESEDLDEEDDEELDFDVDDDEEIDENDVSSDIGKSDNKQPGKANQSSGIGTVGKAKLKEEDDYDEDDMDEDVDLQELINQLIGEDDDYEDEEADEEEAEFELENVQLKADLEEHIKVIKFLRSKINEVNLLNSKLLYTNKLFRSFELDNEKKYKVVETFDRAKNLREVKLIFSTIAESFGAKAKKIVETKAVRKPQSSSSKPVTSTKPKTDILEENVDLKARYQRLANIKK